MKIQYNFRANLYLEISSDVVETFDNHRQNQDQPESGGILLGRIFNGSRVIIEIATTPTGHDQATRYGFVSSRIASQAVVNSIWQRTNGAGLYLGEWHTHPELMPRPSYRDRQMIRNMFNQSKIQTDFLLLIIVGIERIWVGMETGESLRELHKI